MDTTEHTDRKAVPLDPQRGDDVSARTSPPSRPPTTSTTTITTPLRPMSVSIKAEAGAAEEELEATLATEKPSVGSQGLGSSNPNPRKRKTPPTDRLPSDHDQGRAPYPTAPGRNDHSASASSAPHPSPHHSSHPPSHHHRSVHPREHSQNFKGQLGAVNNNNNNLNPTGRSISSSPGSATPSGSGSVATAAATGSGGPTGPVPVTAVAVVLQDEGRPDEFNLDDDVDADADADEGDEIDPQFEEELAVHSTPGVGSSSSNGGGGHSQLHPQTRERQAQVQQQELQSQTKIQNQTRPSNFALGRNGPSSGEGSTASPGPTGISMSGRAAPRGADRESTSDSTLTTTVGTRAREGTSQPNVNGQRRQASHPIRSAASQNPGAPANMTFPARPRSRGRTMSSPSSVEYGHPSINSKHQSQTQAQTQGYRRHYDEGFGPGADRERRERFSASVSPTLRGAETPSLTVTHPLEPQGRRERDGRDQIFVRDHRETQTHRSHRSSPSASHIAHEQVVPVPPNTHPSIAHLPTRNNNGPLSISTAPPHTTSVMSTSTLCNMNSLNTLSFSYPSHPPAKRRRAKRTEEERIAYLRSDPYVAQFEAYRVLCASCDKWIRLRPNSTYCSIPWDAHRKSCLAKKIMNRGSGAAGGGGYALEERNAFLSKDPDVRKFDAERVLCAVCDTWIDMHPEDHLMAVRTWLEHRAECRKDADILTVGLELIGMGAGIMEPARASSGGMVPPVQAIPNNRKREDERNGRVMDVDRYRSESPTYDDHRHQRHPVHTQSPDSYRPRERDVYPLSSTDYRYHSPVTRGEGREHRQFENPTRTLDRRYESPHHASQPPFGGRETRAQRRLSLQYQQRPHPQRERSIASTSAASAPGEHDTDSDTSMDDEGDIDVNAAGDPGIKTAPVSPSRASSLHTTSSNGTQPSGAESRGPYATDSRLQQKEAEKEYHRRSQAQQQQVFNAAAGQFPPGPAHESRRRNAEQRAATLRADKLIKEVEANRVFCSLCMKWVQLRQDSSYCAYPWLQHRGKCLARHQRRAQKAAEIAEIKARRNGSRPQAQGSYQSNAYPSAPGPSHSALHARSPHGLSEMDMKAHGRREESPYRHGSYSTTGSEPGRLSHSRPYPSSPYDYEFDSDFEMDIDDHGRRDGFSNTAGEFGARRQQSTQIAPVSSRRSHRHSRVKHEDMEYDEEGGDRGGNVGHEDIDMDRETRRPDHISKRYHDRPQLDDSPRHHPYNQTRSNSRHHPSSSRIESTTGHSRPHPSTSSPTRKTGAVRTRPVLADLDSVNGRRHFVYDSISHLFNTTYEVTDDMSVSTLLTYLNSAMPPDKYEDFDTAEVVRAVSCLKDKGKILLEGDLIKRVPGSN